MTIIFLDIDGVLNGHQRWSNGYCGIQPKNVEVLNKILNLVPNAKIVISSAWRYMVCKEAMTLRGFEYLLLINGLNCKNRVYDTTLRDEILSTRGKQIKNFLTSYKKITKYVVLDDMLHDFDKYGINYVKTDSFLGLTEEQIPKILSYIE